MATHAHVGETLQQNITRNRAIPQRALLIADLPPGAVYAAAAAMFGAKVNANLTPHTAATDFFQAMSGYANLHATVRVAPTAAALKRLLDCEEAARNNGAAALLDPVSRTYAGLVAASVVFISPTGDVVFAGGSESYGQAEDVYAFSNWAHGRYNREVAYNASVLGKESCAELYNSLGSEPCYWLKLCFLHGNSWHLHAGTYGGFNLVFANGTIQCMITVVMPNNTSNGEHTLASHLRAGGFPEVVGARTVEELTKDGWKIGVLTGSGGMPLDSTATANVIGALTMRLNDDLKHERRTTIHFKRLWPALHPGGGLVSLHDIHIAEHIYEGLHQAALAAGYSDTATLHALLREHAIEALEVVADATSVPAFVAFSVEIFGMDDRVHDNDAEATSTKAAGAGAGAVGKDTSPVSSPYMVCNGKKRSAMDMEGRYYTASDEDEDGDDDFEEEEEAQPPRAKARTATATKAKAAAEAAAKIAAAEKVKKDEQAKIEAAAKAKAKAKAKANVEAKAKAAAAADKAAAKAMDDNADDDFEAKKTAVEPSRRASSRKSAQAGGAKTSALMRAEAQPGTPKTPAAAQRSRRTSGNSFYGGNSPAMRTPGRHTPLNVIHNSKKKVSSKEKQKGVPKKESPKKSTRNSKRKVKAAQDEAEAAAAAAAAAKVATAAAEAAALNVEIEAATAAAFLEAEDYAAQTSTPLIKQLSPSMHRSSRYNDSSADECDDAAVDTNEVFSPTGSTMDEDEDEEDNDEYGANGPSSIPLQEADRETPMKATKKKKASSKATTMHAAKKRKNQAKKQPANSRVDDIDEDEGKDDTIKGDLAAPAKSKKKKAVPARKQTKVAVLPGRKGLPTASLRETIVRFPLDAKARRLRHKQLTALVSFTRSDDLSVLQQEAARQQGFSDTLVNNVYLPRIAVAWACVDEESGNSPAAEIPFAEVMRRAEIAQIQSVFQVTSERTASAILRVVKTGYRSGQNANCNFVDAGNAFGSALESAVLDDDGHLPESARFILKRVLADWEDGHEGSGTRIAIYGAFTVAVKAARSLTTTALNSETFDRLLKACYNGIVRIGDVQRVSDAVEGVMEMAGGAALDDLAKASTATATFFFSLFSSSLRQLESGGGWTAFLETIAAVKQVFGADVSGAADKSAFASLVTTHVKGAVAFEAAVEAAKQVFGADASGAANKLAFASLVTTHVKGAVAFEAAVEAAEQVFGADASGASNKRAFASLVTTHVKGAVAFEAAVEAAKQVFGADASGAANKSAFASLVTTHVKGAVAFEAAVEAAKQVFGADASGAANKSAFASLVTTHVKDAVAFQAAVEAAKQVFGADASGVADKSAFASLVTTHVKDAVAFQAAVEAAKQVFGADASGAADKGAFASLVAAHVRDPVAFGAAVEAAKQVFGADVSGGTNKRAFASLAPLVTAHMKDGDAFKVAVEAVQCHIENLIDFKLELLKAAPTEMKLKSLQTSLLCAFLIKFNKIPGVLRVPGTIRAKSRANLVESITMVCTSLKMYEKGPGGGGGGAAAASKVDASPSLKLARKLDAVKGAIRQAAPSLEALKKLRAKPIKDLLKRLGNVCGDQNPAGHLVKKALVERIENACIKWKVYEEASGSNAVGAAAAPLTHDANT